MKKTNVVLAAIAALIVLSAACTQTEWEMVEITNEVPETVEIAQTVEVPYTVEVPQTVEVLETVVVPQTVEVTREVTKIVEGVIEQTVEVPVLATDTPTPTSGPTRTPPPNFVATATAEVLAELTAPRGDGFYLVGVDIAPGLWRSQGSRSDCYWARLNSSQGILDNHFGSAGGTVRIRASDFEVHFDDCGIWVYLGP